jgi:hypothetical protein
VCAWARRDRRCADHFCSGSHGPCPGLRTRAPAALQAPQRPDGTLKAQVRGTEPHPQDPTPGRSACAGPPPAAGAARESANPGHCSQRSAAPARGLRLPLWVLEDPNGRTNWQKPMPARHPYPAPRLKSPPFGQAGPPPP